MQKKEGKTYAVLDKFSSMIITKDKNTQWNMGNKIHILLAGK